MVKIAGHPCTKCELWHNSGLLQNVKYVNIYVNNTLLHAAIPYQLAKKLSKKIAIINGHGVSLRAYAGTSRLDFT